MAIDVTLSQAAELIPYASRIMVIGNSGGGKTTLALRIAAHFDLEYQSMDRDVRWLPGWVQRDRDAQRDILRTLAHRERWVMDGTGPSSFDLRVPRADMIIWLRVPRWQALTGLALRVAKHFGRVRPAMAEGCPEPLPDFAFLKFIWTFDRVTAPRIQMQIDTHGPDVALLTLRSRRDASALFKGSNPGR